MKVTDKDREYALAAAKECNGLNDVVDAIAQAREEGRREEREACAKVCDEIEKREYEEGDHGAWCGPNECAAAIRALGED